ncbi:MAG: hypothetical protein FWB98_02475 [Defluviitaleaceae bacterium]|nr:hypothetical protein [Defluviitaleaceae bacterium]
MKIETGESLIYSWLRHEKLCQITQLNWKTSPFWSLDNYDDLQILMGKFDDYYRVKYGYDIFKGCSLEQVLRQAEIDAVGIAYSETAQSIYAVDIAYHSAGINYGDKEKTLSKIILKCIRTVLCLYGCFNMASGEVIFASPKINPAIEKELVPMFEELTSLIKQFGLEITVLLYCNDAFFSDIMQPIVEKGTKIADTSELFLRSIQMYQMFNPSALQKNAPIHKPDNIQRARTRTKTDTTNRHGIANDKIPRWAANKSQNNHKIIRAYFQLLHEAEKVTRQALEGRCQNEEMHPDVYVRDFKGNFNSMKSDKGNSHGKTFIENGINVTIWDEVAETLERYRSLFME